MDRSAPNGRWSGHTWPAMEVVDLKTADFDHGAGPAAPAADLGYRRALAMMDTASVQTALDRGLDTVIVPVGACESHGPHAPLSTDTIVAEEVALRLAEHIDALVAPCLPVGFSAQHLTFAGSISLAPATLIQVLREYVTSLAGQGFRRFVLFSGHGGNRTAIDVAARELKAEHGGAIQVMVLNLMALQTSATFRQRGWRLSSGAPLMAFGRRTAGNRRHLPRWLGTSGSWTLAGSRLQPETSTATSGAPATRMLGWSPSTCRATLPMAVGEIPGEPRQSRGERCSICLVRCWPIALRASGRIFERG